MHKFVCLLVLLSVCLCGCAKEYEPPKESIPDVIPSTRGGGKAQGGPGAAANADATGGKQTGGMPPALPK